ncbi:MAG: 4-hydroxybenzoyl-CoA thioesterase [Pseudohongiella sp.]|nr:MAG: 4-hydroxybenzoyl-CoA thioesterase [Pseudohongiella sp.]
MGNEKEPVVIESNFHVRYAETDAMGVVHHAGYLVYFEEARSHYMRELGSDYALIEKEGFRLPVSEVGLRYVGSLRYGDRVEIRAWIEEDKSRRIRFAYEVRREGDEAILVTGFTEHIWTDLNGRVTRAPSQWVEMMSV